MIGYRRMALNGAIALVATLAGLAIAPTTSTAAPARHRHFTVKARPKDSTLILGTPAVITGHISPFQRHEHADFQIKRSGGWDTVAKHKIAGHSFSFSYDSKQPQRLTARVKVPANGRIKSGHSKKFKFATYGWLNLADLKPSSGRWTTGMQTIAGTTYDSSVYQSWSCSGNQNCNSAKVSYDLGKRCLEVTGVAGVGDASSAQDYYDLSLVSGGRTLFDYNAVAGFEQSFTIDTSAVSTITLSGIRQPYDSGGPDYAGFGDARALCY